MRKIVVTLIVASLLSATTAVPVFAGGWGGHSHGRGGGVDLFWPITAALAIPAAIVGTVAHFTVPEPVYAPPPVPLEPQAYTAPETYYSPRPYYERRVYVAPRGYDSSREYYHDRGDRDYYRSYRGGW